MTPEKPPCFLRVAASAGRRVGKSKSFYSHLSLPFPIFSCKGWGEGSAARCGGRGFWHGAGPLFSCCTGLFPAPACAVCTHLATASCCLLSCTCLCAYQHQMLGTIQIKTKCSSSGLVFIYLPAPAHTVC